MENWKSPISDNRDRSPEKRVIASCTLILSIRPDPTLPALQGYDRQASPATSGSQPGPMQPIAAA